MSDGPDDIRAVIFDLDGVLVDSEPVWEQVRREVVLADLGELNPELAMTLSQPQSTLE